MQSYDFSNEYRLIPLLFLPRKVESQKPKAENRKSFSLVAALKIIEKLNKKINFESNFLIILRPKADLICQESRVKGQESFHWSLRSKL